MTAMRARSSARKEARTKRPIGGSLPRFYDGRLHDLLVRKRPRFVRVGRVDVARLCSATGNSRFTVYRWMQDDRVSPAAGKSLIRVSGGQLTPEDLAPFVIV